MKRLKFNKYFYKIEFYLNDCTKILLQIRLINQFIIKIKKILIMLHDLRFTNKRKKNVMNAKILKNY